MIGLLIALAVLLSILLLLAFGVIHEQDVRNDELSKRAARFGAFIALGERWKSLPLDEIEKILGVTETAPI